MFHAWPYNSNFQYIIANMQNRMSAWKTNLLSMAGRLILTKYTLASIPFHVMQFIKLPDKITKNINQTQRNYVWWSTIDKKKIHLVSWEKIFKPKAKGGSNLKKSEVKNEAACASLAWRLYHNTQSI